MSEQQRVTALATANERRLAKAALRARVHAIGGRRPWPAFTELAHVIAENHACLTNTFLVDAIRWAPYATWQHVEHILHHAGASEWKRVGDLTTRQREALVFTLRHPGLYDSETAA